MALTIKSRPRRDGTVSWFLYFRPALPDGTSLMPVPGCTRLEDRAKVEAFARPWRDGLKRGVAPPKQETADAWYGRYVEYQSSQGIADADKKQARWNKWISPRIGRKPVSALTRDDVEDVRDALDAAISSGQIAGKTAINIWTTLTSGCKAMVTSKQRDLRVLPSNPALGVEPPGDRNTRKVRRKTFVYPKEATALLSCEAVPLEWRELYAVALYTYLRPGELRVLTWADVDLAVCLISVTKAWDYEDEQIKPPKTSNGIRRVPIEPALAPLLERLATGRAKADLVAPLLSAIEPTELARTFRAHLRAAKVERAELHATTKTHVQSNFRSCRDSGLTWLAMSGLGVDKIMRRAGHDMIQTTMGYIKLAEDLGGTLGTPMGPLPAALVSPGVNRPVNVNGAVLQVPMIKADSGEQKRPQGDSNPC